MELIGRRFGHIRVTDAVGQGGMGDVYAGYDEKLDRKVALKALHSDQRLDAEARERLLREARALSKLDHPNICRIHDYLEGGDVDMLVLEYIDGRTLQDLLREPRTRAEKLQIAIAIAEVLVAAHRVGIIHRDLKPENVMLTSGGDVKVLDFGLARWLTAFSSMRVHPVSPNALTVQLRVKDVEKIDSDPWHGLEDLGSTAVMSAHNSEPRIRRPFLATAVGVTMGTPLYMSPEQARGEALTTASDLYAFGLLLQSLFSGNEPHPLGLNAHEVILRAARGEALPAVGLPRDITALINSLKQFAPADRPTAVEALRRLHYLADKVQRIARRVVAVTAVALLLFGAWRYFVDLTRERTAAIAARSEAERRRAQAENLIEFMLGDLRKKLEPVGRLDILDDVGARALTYVESLRPELMSAEELARNAKALNQLGDVRMGQGKTPEALDIFRRSLKLASEAVRREPRNAEAIKVLGATHFWIGNGLRLQGDTDQALAHMREYMRAGDTLAAVDANNDEFQMERAYGHSGVALILEAKGERREALEHYEVSLQVKQGIALRDPTNADAKAELARAFNKVGVVLYGMGELRAARERFERELDLLRFLVSHQPENKTWTHRLANNLAYLARVLGATGESQRAYALNEEELGIERELAERDPQNVDWKRNVAVTTWRLANSLAARGENVPALKMYADARSGMGRAIEQAPARTALVKEKAAVEIDYARVLTATGAESRARELLRNVIAGLERFSPPDRATHYYTGQAFYTLGELERARNPAQASVAWQRAEAELTPLVAATTNPFELDLWTRVLIRRGRTGDARNVLAQIERSGYDTTELRKLCSESGC